MAASISRKRCQDSLDLSPPPVKRRAYERFSKLVAKEKMYLSQNPAIISSLLTKSVPSQVMTPELEDNNPIHNVTNKHTSRELFASIANEEPNIRKQTCRDKENTRRPPVTSTKASCVSPSPRQIIQDRKKPSVNNGIPLRDSPSRKSAKGSKQKLETVKERLHVSAVMESLPCREKEITDIISFVRGKLICNGSGCMYISGVPGTGKTATVCEVSKRLQSMVETGNIPKFHFMEINGLRLTEPRQAYVEILKQLKGEKTTADKAAAILNDYFCSGRRNKRKETIVLLADELDLLWTRKQSILYNLFDWPSHSNAKLIVLAIANTMNLPERLMMGRVSSRMGLTRLDFHPYTFTQLQEIINKRLTSSKIFNSDAVEFASRKVASVSGDARRALDICRRAVEIADRGCKKGNCRVSLANVMAATEEMFTSPRVIAIKNCSQNQKLFFRALLASLKSTNCEETTLKHVFSLLRILCQEEGVPVISVTQGTSICIRLVSMNLILLESGRGCSGTYRHVRLNVTQDDLHYALMRKRTNC